LQAPRYSFLPLLLKEIRENFVELAIHEEDLVSYKEADWWFEEDLKDPSTDQERLSANVGREEASREPCRW
jgi:ParB-like chromosome segregation protein Spo0J